MQSRIAAFEKLFMAGAMNGAISPVQQQQQPPTPMQYPQDAHPYMGTPIGTPRPGEAQSAGLIQVPEDMKRILSAQMAVGQPYPVPQQQFPGNPAVIRQQQIQQQQMQQNRWRNGAGPYFGKLMVGSLAGLMILEAVRENEVSNEKPEGRGLFAPPMQALSFVASHMHVHLMGHFVSSAQVISTLKLLVLCGALLWVFAPWLFVPREHKAKKAQQTRASLQAAPSPASPIHVRQQAWLTAIQTVWVPQHNFLLEAAALILKTMKLSLRNTIGVQGYQMLTGLTEEQETARVKAWTIALDAQLAGGDMEINKSRLTLTLLASGTLPDTPLRLMLKALHIRVLLWELGRTGLQLGFVNLIASKLARSRWNEARQLHRMWKHGRKDAAEQSDEELPSHLAVLLEQDCDDVLSDMAIQRAHNLAWNLPTTHNVAENTDGMDTVVDDLAVRSPMDAVAAWWSTQTLHKTLAASLAASKDDTDARREIEKNLDLIVKAAPIGSDAQLRALVATAVLVDEKRGANIGAALQAIGPMNTEELLNKPQSVIIDTTGASSPDEQMALRCAMAIAHLQRIKTVSPPHDGMRLIETIMVPGSAVKMTLLGCTAAFKLMEELYAHRSAAEAFSISLERLAGTLRIWVGGATGDMCGVGPAVRHKMVDRCLAITKSVVGMDNDTGYGSMSDCEDEHGC
jgi:hypothetical protein